MKKALKNQQSQLQQRKLQIDKDIEHFHEFLTNK